MWEPQLATCAERGWRVIAPHFRGFGASRSDPNGTDLVPMGSDARPTTDDYAGDVIDLLDALHVHEAVVVGLSMGGYVAFAILRLAARYVHGLVLADTRPQADTAEVVESRKRMAQLAREHGVRAIADEMLPKLLGETTRRERPDVAATIRSLAMSNTPEALAAALGALMQRPDSTPLLASIHVPTLVIVGEEDGVTPPPIAEEMSKAIAGSQLAIIPRAGHISNLERADDFNLLVGAFIRGVDSRAP